MIRAPDTDFLPQVSRAGPAVRDTPDRQTVGGSPARRCKDGARRHSAPAVSPKIFLMGGTAALPRLARVMHGQEEPLPWAAELVIDAGGVARLDLDLQSFRHVPSGTCRVIDAEVL